MPNDCACSGAPGDEDFTPSRDCPVHGLPAETRAAMLKSGMYRHYKGGYYIVFGVARFSTNGEQEQEPVVVYYSVTKQCLWVRALREFTSTVRVGSEDVPRFVFVA